MRKIYTITHIKEEKIMCNICHCGPCDPRCPNAISNQPLKECIICGIELFEGDKYYEVNNVPVCVDCVAQAIKPISDCIEPIECTVCGKSKEDMLEDEEEYYLLEGEVVCIPCMQSMKETAEAWDGYDE
jgi:hypothetical protein